MNAITRIDKAGRIVLPKKVRDRLRLAPGDTLSIEVTDCEATLRHAVPSAALTQESGIWVFGAGQAVAQQEARDLLQDAREERLVDLSR